MVGIVDGMEIDHGDIESDIEMEDEMDAPIRPVKNSVRVRLYDEPRSWWHSLEIDCPREPNGDLNLVRLADLLHAEGTIRVGNPVC
jgi:hypothetical protein